MSGMRRSLRWYHEMRVLADQERTRLGHPEIDLEHLLLALIGIGGPVAEAVAAGGADIRDARRALAGLHAERLAALGVRLSEPAGAPRRGWLPSAAPLTRRAQLALERAARRERPEAALFETLRREPSGHIALLLQRLGCPGPLPEPPEGSTLDRSSEAQTAPAPRNLEWVLHRAFVPDTPGRLWRLLSDPARWLEWNGWQHASAIEAQPGILRVEAAHAPRRGHPGWNRSEYTVARFEPERLVQWERSWPEAPRRVVQALRIELEPAPAGTRILLATRMERLDRRGPRAALSRPLAGLRRWIMRGYLRRLARHIAFAVAP